MLHFPVKPRNYSIRLLRVSQKNSRFPRKTLGFREKLQVSEKNSRFRISKNTGSTLHKTDWWDDAWKFYKRHRTKISILPFLEVNCSKYFLPLNLFVHLWQELFQYTAKKRNRIQTLKIRTLRCFFQSFGLGNHFHLNRLFYSTTQVFMSIFTAIDSDKLNSAMCH